LLGAPRVAGLLLALAPAACLAAAAALMARTADSSVAVVGPKATPAPKEMAMAAVTTRRKTRTSMEYPLGDDEDEEVESMVMVGKG